MGLLSFASSAGGGALLTGLASGLFGYKSAQKTNVAASAQSQRQMDFQERMSKTAHQREVKDLRLAGLNPILSGTGGAGASTPSGAQAPVIDKAATASKSVSSALAIRRMEQELKNMEAQEWVSKSQQHLNNQMSINKGYESSELKAQSDLWKQIGAEGKGSQWLLKLRTLLKK